MGAGKPGATADTVRTSMSVAVGLGSNTGDRAANLRFGVAGLAELHDGFRFSGVFETQPKHVADQPPYLNACCIGRTSLTARQLLLALHELELRAGRQPGGQRYGPRPLDLDLLLYGERVIEESDLVVPHPRLRERAFVLVPLAELAADWKVPVSRGAAATTVGELARGVDEEGIKRTGIELHPA
jgi:2-amino-4-hydroxy-6-hydroxymethyldihydropteridine diphosphokinase